MKKLMFVVCALAFGAFAEGEAAKGGKEMVYPVHPSKMAEYNAKTGGLVPPPESAKVLMILDARSEKLPELSKFTGAAERMLSLAIDTKNVKVPDSMTAQSFAFSEKKGKAGAVVLFYERKGDPTLSVFPEDGIALVNFVPLKCDDPIWRSRLFATEFWRSIGFALGAYATPSQMSSSMQGIFSPEDFKTLQGAGLAPMQVVGIAANKSKLGIYSRDPVPYSRACREGWAPAPTNEVQRSLYKRFADPTDRFKEDFKK